LYKITINLFVSSREFTHRVKSISMAKFIPQEITALQEGGNEVEACDYCNIMFHFFFLSGPFTKSTSAMCNPENEVHRRMVHTCLS
jgi:hypothetical protein